VLLDNITHRDGMSKEDFIIGHEKFRFGINRKGMVKLPHATDD